ncbi:MAG: hypothetical protein ACFWUC_07140 [Oscillospiraceae bacterium]
MIDYAAAWGYNIRVKVGTDIDANGNCCVIQRPALKIGDYD